MLVGFYYVCIVYKPIREYEMSLAAALKTAIAIKEYTDEQESIAEKKKQLKEKSWDVAILHLGGVTWWSRSVDKLVGDVVKVTKQKVKIVAVPQGEEELPKYVNEVKGKFSFINGCGVRIHLSVKSYKDADEFVTEFYGKGKFRVSNFY